MASVSSGVHSTLPDSMVEGGLLGTEKTYAAVLLDGVSSGSSLGSTSERLSVR